MTLLIIAITPDGIVIGADSALTDREGGETTVLTSFSKIVDIPRLSIGIAVAGEAWVDQYGWRITSWLRKFADDVSEAKTPQDFVVEVADALNEVIVRPEQHHVLLAAAWIIVRDEKGNSTLVPQAFEISRHPDTDDKYKAKPLISPDKIRAVINWRPIQGQQYPDC